MHYVTNNSVNAFNWQNTIAPMRNVPFCSLQHLKQNNYFGPGAWNGTINSVHYFFPFILSFLVLVHLYCLHIVGLNNMGLSNVETIPFHPPYVLKHLSGNNFFVIGIW